MTRLAKRIKVVALEDREFRLAPLKMGQIEELIEMTGDVDPREARRRTWETIRACIANANRGEAPSIDELKMQLDMDEFLELHTAALEVTGLKMASTGEAQAATEMTGPTSVAA
jgi:capsid portal protein